ncbi:MAG: hypothetical protein ACFCUO_09450 [Rhodospirillales bacterium]
MPRSLACEARELRETVRALRCEMERVRRDGDLRLRRAVAAADRIILELQATIRRQRALLDGQSTADPAATVPIGVDKAAEPAAPRARVRPPTAALDGGAIAAATVAAGPPARLPAERPGAERGELRETIVRLRARLDEVDALCERRVKAIESACRARCRELEQTIAILREPLPRATDQH